MRARIYESLREMKNRHVHIEVTNLVISKIGDSIERIREPAMCMRDNLGEDIPFHLLRLNPNYQVIEIPSTSLKTLEQACEASSEVGKDYVYVRSVPGHRYENTYYPIVERYWSNVTVSRSRSSA